MPAIKDTRKKSAMAAKKIAVAMLAIVRILPSAGISGGEVPLDLSAMHFNDHFPQQFRAASVGGLFHFNRTCRCRLLARSGH